MGPLTDQAYHTASVPISHVRADHGELDADLVKSLLELKLSSLAEAKHKAASALLKIQQREIALRNQGNEQPTTDATPPRLFEMILHFLMPRQTRQAIVGDMQEAFQRDRKRFGERYARRLYCKDAVLTIASIAGRALVKVSAIAWLGRAMQWLMSKLGS